MFCFLMTNFEMDMETQNFSCRKYYWLLRTISVKSGWYGETTAISAICEFKHLLCILDFFMQCHHICS